MMRKIIGVLFTLLMSLAFMNGCVGAEKEKSWVFAFNDDDEGFTPIFADYHDDGSGLDSYGMQTDYREIPVDGSRSMGLYIAASNRSDDLFMGYVKKLEGMYANHDYDFSVSLRLATSVGSGWAGIGGSPGTAVYVKGGVTAAEPQSGLVGTHYRLNIDIGVQSEGGADLTLIGDMEKPETAPVEGFAFKKMSFSVSVKTNGDGCAYLTIGTDSGFEGFTEYYIDDVTIAAKRR